MPMGSNTMFENYKCKRKYIHTNNHLLNEFKILQTFSIPYEVVCLFVLPLGCYIVNHKDCTFLHIMCLSLRI
jgi:hypothetical protein